MLFVFDTLSLVLVRVTQLVRRYPDWPDRLSWNALWCVLVL